MAKRQLNWRPFGWQDYAPRRSARGLPIANADNCGTGAGGFKRGNTCAGGSSSKQPMQGMVFRQNDTLEGLAKELGAEEGEINKDGYEQYISGYREGNVGIEKYAKNLVQAATKLGFKRASPIESLGSGPDTPRQDRSWRITLEHPEGHRLDVRFNPGTEFHRDSMAYDLDFVPKENREGYAISREAAKASSYSGYSTFSVLDYARIGNSEQAVKLHLQAADMHARYAVTKDQLNAKALHRDAEAAHRIAADYHKEKAGLQ